MKILKVFFYKDGEVSKTAIFLSLATLILLILWPFQSLFVGIILFGWWTIPEFNVTAAVTVLFTLSALYVANHKIPGHEEVITPEQFGELRGQVDNLIKSVSGQGNNNDD